MTTFGQDNCGYHGTMDLRKIQKADVFNFWINFLAKIAKR